MKTVVLFSREDLGILCTKTYYFFEGSDGWYSQAGLPQYLHAFTTANYVDFFNKLSSPHPDKASLLRDHFALKVELIEKEIERLLSDIELKKRAIQDIQKTQDLISSCSTLKEAVFTILSNEGREPEI